MDDFIRKGSEQACVLLKYLGSARFDTTCMGFENGDAYYKAGVVFWTSALCLFVGILLIIRASVRGLD